MRILCDLGGRGPLRAVVPKKMYCLSVQYLLNNVETENEQLSLYHDRFHINDARNLQYQTHQQMLTIRLEVGFTLSLATKALRESRGIALLYF